MIPVSLSLRNFLSYGEDVPPLDFTAFHVACVCGFNGHGKSALLDAITWALWGEARKASEERKPDSGLLHTGATEMRVVFEFELEETRYRVSRSYRKTPKTSTSVLEFQVYSPDAGSYKTLSEGGSIGRTQRQIDALLRMGYDTFINSAFILQGRADEFTKRTARERKEILGKILGLSRYDALVALAVKHTEKAEEDIEQAQGQLEEIDAAIAQKRVLSEEIAGVFEELNAVEETLELNEEHLGALRRKQVQQEAYSQEHGNLGSEQVRLDRERIDTMAQADTARGELETYQQTLDRKQEILIAVERHRVLQDEASRLQQKLNSLRTLERRQNELDREIATRRHEAERRLDRWEALIAEAQRTISEATNVLKDRAEIEKGIAALQEARKAEQKLEEARSNRESLEQKVRELERVLEGECSALQVSLQSLKETQQANEEIIADTPRRQAAAEQARTKREEAQGLEEVQQQTKERGNALLAQAEAALGRLSGLQKDLEETEKQQASLQDIEGARCPLCGSELDAKHRAEVFSQLDARVHTLKAESDSIEMECQVADVERTECGQKYRAARTKLAGMGDTAQADAQARISLQEAEIASDELVEVKGGVQMIEAHLAKAQTEGPEALALADARAQVEALQYDPQAHNALRNTIRELAPVEAREVQLSMAEERLQKAENELNEVKGKRDVAQQELDEQRYAPNLYVELNEVKANIEGLGYDATHHSQTTEDLESLREAPAQRERLESAEREMAGAQSRLSAAEDRSEAIRARRKMLLARTLEIESVLREGARITQQVAQLESHIETTRPRRDLFLEKRAALRAQHERCVDQEETRGEEVARLKTAEEEAQTYGDLATAFGKNGIQALIIEQAIPEIEEDANRILGRLTGNRAQIALESLRDLKKGGSRETLDIKISDELGERRYELYSGGEAFRVDFAIRIALSKLLARRAGTRLRILAIDEGFGTQDQEGLNQLVEAIQIISEDFEKILVFTHVEALKQAFPVRIEVFKYPDTGSRFEVVY